MIKKIVTTEDFNGNVVSGTYCFNLTQTELSELEAKTEGGIENKLTSYVENDDKAGMFEFIKELILAAYGEVSEDGLKFLKKKNGVRLRDEFEQSCAFDAVFVEIADNEAAALEFLKGVLPKKLVDTAEKNGSFKALSFAETE